METPLASTASKIETLKRCAFLNGLAESVLANIAAGSETLQISSDETIITLGEPGSTMYFLISGQVRVHAGEVTWATIEAGEVFGEMAVLDAEVRSASVTAERDSLLLSVERDVFYHALSTDPGAFKAVLHSVLQREREIVHEIKTRTTKLIAFEKELEIGRQIQADFLPENLPDIEGWEIASHFEAAHEVAGDFYDVFKLKTSQHLVIVIGDVCDKGVGAALYMTLFRSLIRATCLYGFMNSMLDKANSSDADDAVTKILLNSIGTTNRYIATTHSNSSMFASVFIGLLDPATGELSYVNAGHEPPMIFRSHGEVKRLKNTGGVLGLFPFAKHTVETTKLHSGDLIFTYTDGVNEAKNAEGEQFTDDRILETATATEHDVGAFLNNMFEAVRAFRGEAEQSDDITMLALRYLP